MGALLLSPLYLLVNAYVARWLLLWMGSFHHLFRSAWVQGLLISGYSILALTPLLGFLCPWPSMRWLLRSLGNYWLGTFLYILLTVLAFDGVRLLLRLLGLDSFSILSSPRWLSVVGTLAVLVVVFVSGWGILQSHRLAVHQETIAVEKPLPSSVADSGELKIAVVADLHLGYNTRLKQLYNIVRELNAQSPDLVCFAGDIFDNEYNAIPYPDTIASALSAIHSRYGVYACWGNHDVSEKILAGFTFPGDRDKPQDPQFAAFLELADIRLLEDETVALDDGLILSGRLDPEMAKKLGRQRMSPSKLLSAKYLRADGMAAEPLIVVMDHQPRELTALSDAGADIVVSGHTHDGQVFPANLVVAAFWENPCGILKRGSMYSCVTSGVGVWGPSMRVGTRNELLILNVRSTVNVL